MSCFKRQVTWLFWCCSISPAVQQALHYYRKIRQAKTNMQKDSSAIKNPRQQILYMPALKPLAILIAPPLLYLFQQSEGSYQN